MENNHLVIGLVVVVALLIWNNYRKIHPMLEKEKHKHKKLINWVLVIVGGVLAYQLFQQQQGGAGSVERLY